MLYALPVKAQWLRGRATDSRLRVPGFESCAPASLFCLHCISLLSCIQEYMDIESGGYVYDYPSCINCYMWLDASQRSRDGLSVNKYVREVKYKALSRVLRIG